MEQCGNWKLETVAPFSRRHTHAIFDDMLEEYDRLLKA